MNKTRVKVAQQNVQPARRSGVDRPGTVPRLPHEHDESSDSQGSAQPTVHEQIGRRAFDDVEQGRVDTDRGPVFDEMRNDRRSPVHVPSPPAHAQTHGPGRNAAAPPSTERTREDDTH